MSRRRSENGDDGNLSESEVSNSLVPGSLPPNVNQPRSVVRLVTDSHAERELAQVQAQNDELNERLKRGQEQLDAFFNQLSQVHQERINTANQAQEEINKLQAAIEQLEQQAQIDSANRKEIEQRSEQQQKMLDEFQSAIAQVTPQGTSSGASSSSSNAAATAIKYLLEKSRKEVEQGRQISDLRAQLHAKDAQMQALRQAQNRAPISTQTRTAAQVTPHFQSFNASSDQVTPIEIDEQGPWVRNPTGVHGVRRRKPTVPYLTPSTIRLGGTFLPPPVIPEFSEATVEPSSECPVPPSIATILGDPNISEEVKEDYRRGSMLFRAYFSQALGGIFRSNLDGIPNYKKPRQTKAIKARFRAIIARDSKAIRNDINARVREMFYFYLQIDQETDVPSCDIVSSKAIAEWGDPVIQGPGPSLDNVVFDWLGGRKSQWNIVLVSLLARKIMDEAQASWSHLPKYDLMYWQETVWGKFQNLSFRWNRSQCRRKRDGNFETPHEASARLLATQKSERKAARQNTRRHSKHEIRKRICIAMVKLKADEGDPDQDLEFWEWALKVIERLGADGMSSDESGGEELVGHDHIYQVKIMVWRHRMEDVLKHIDEARYCQNGIFSLRGSTGLRRCRAPPNPPSSWPKSHRPAVEHLPYVFYDENWFQEVDKDVRQATLHVSAEEFQWAQLYCRN